MFLDESYFIGSLTIAQLGEKSVNDRLKDFINQYEPRIMEAALGYDFYQEFLEGLDVGSDEEPEQRWLDLKNGVGFINTATYKRRWMGFANITAKYSAIAGFIYYEYMRDLVSQNTGIGVVKNKGENSEPVDFSHKMVDAYNQSCRDMGILWEFLHKNTQTDANIYPEFNQQQVDYYSNGWLTHHVSSGFQTINTFGI